MCKYCGSDKHKIHEVIYNIMVSYKKACNHHIPGLGCWCKPTAGKMFLIHRNYEWSGSEWITIKESEPQ